jgi:hypothetical protein
LLVGEPGVLGVRMVMVLAESQVFVHVEFAAAGVQRIGSSATVTILSDFRKLLAETARD